MSHGSMTGRLAIAWAGLLIMGCADARMPSDTSVDGPPVTSLPKSPQAVTPSNVVTEWVAIVQPAIHNADAFRPPASSEVLQATVMLAIYDAVMAIEGGFEPFAAKIDAPPGADVRAAVATAGYLTARARVASSQFAYLDGQYTAYRDGIPDGQAKTDGIQVGEDAATALLALRANDGFNNVVSYECSATPVPPGEFEPNGGCGTQPVDAKVGKIRPFTFADPSRFRPDGPGPLTSDAYTADFIEARDYGRKTSTFRTGEQTDIAYFWSEHSFVHWNRNLIKLVSDHGLTVRETARLLAMVYTASADALIAGFEAKYFYRFWRPRTAIPQADTDGNPDTDPDPTWEPLLTVNHPEYPSAHSFWSTALLEVVADYFGTNKVTWTIATSTSAVPQLGKAERTYHDLNAIGREIYSARVWAGLHWRHSTRHGAQIGRKVAKYVVENFFRPTT